MAEENFLKRLFDEYNDENYIIEEKVKQEINQVDEKTIELIQHQLVNNLSYKCTVNTSILMNSMPGVELNIPKTKKDIKSRFTSDLNFECYVICSCENLIKDSEFCENCKVFVKLESKQLYRYDSFTSSAEINFISSI